MASHNESNGIWPVLTDRRVALYGTSALTEKFIKEFGSENVVGILDGYKISGAFCGKRIIDLSDCIQLGIDAIIICARKNSVSIVAARIAAFCLENRILLYDIDRNDLLASSKAETISNDYFYINEFDLIEKLSRYDVISFDIFDTLLCRKTLYSTDVFFATDEEAKRHGTYNFLENRLQYIDAANSLEAIYCKLKDSGILSDSNANALCEFEYRFDEKNLLAREKMRDIFNTAKKLKKQIYFVSDTWYNQTQLEEILNANGYNGYSAIISSCGYGVTKTGGLFRELRAKIGQRICMHIGDDYEADGVAPVKYEIEPFLIKSPRDMLSISMYRDILRYDNTYANRYAIGLFASKIFNNPFALYASDGIASLNTAFDVGYLFIAPIITGFVIELAKYAKGKYSQILFLSRDGFLPMKMYQHLTSSQTGEYPTAIYFHTSRTACVSASVKNREDFEGYNEIPFEDTDTNLLSSRFAFEAGSHHKQNIFEELINHSKRLNDNYRKYSSNINLKNSLIVDFVAGGTCQFLLSEIFNEHLDGYYFKRLNEKKYRQLDVVSYVGCDNSFAEEIYLFLENVIGSNEPSLKFFSDYGKPVFFKEKRSPEMLTDIKQAQDGILSYFCDYINVAGADVSPCLELCDTLLKYIKREYSNIAEMPLLDSDIFDEFTSRRFNALNRQL